MVTGIHFLHGKEVSNYAHVFTRKGFVRLRQGVNCKLHCISIWSSKIVYRVTRLGVTYTTFCISIQFVAIVCTI